MVKRLCIFLLPLSLMMACSTHTMIIASNETEKEGPISFTDKNSWWKRDIQQDTIPGVSLNRAVSYISNRKKGADVIVAVIDMSVDIGHQYLQGKMWVNQDEIVNNNIDDDANGYVDDINGWNFIGHSDGKSTEYVNYEYTRFLRRYHALFSGKDSIKNINENPGLFDEYTRAQKKYESQSDYAKRDLRSSKYLLLYFDKAKLKFDELYPSKRPSAEELYEIYKQEKTDKELARIYYTMFMIERHSYTKEALQQRYDIANERLDKMLNKDFDDRKMIADSPDDIEDKYYGNNIVDYNTEFLSHGTLVAGIIGAVDSEHIKIMPVCISAYGDEHDKDLSLAVRYAVDNGAKVINISSGKEFSLHEDWVLDALKYAERNNVLVVTSAGNGGNDLDLAENYNYPNDTDSKGQEMISNFIKVGASGHSVKANLKRPSSNYGKNEVDLFAPGTDILTISSNQNGFEIVSGTSIATPIVSAIAALIYAHYPNLSAAEVKQVLMESGVMYDIMVNAPTKEDKERMIPFYQLSKSGKIVNAYNALLMAENLSKK
ncbi:S8 family serine peptidase [Sungkyunkwania multivorans]|uniref:S8 family serine peptidase n=1 Tax=Sungkyunkwania multivorans TaxID=1173618 RepID=A0ABW3D0P5_9FLAO